MFGVVNLFCPPAKRGARQAPCLLRVYLTRKRTETSQARVLPFSLTAAFRTHVPLPDFVYIILSRNRRRCGERIPVESSTDGQNDLAVLAHLPVPACIVSLAISGLPKQELLSYKSAIRPLSFSVSGGISRILDGSFRSTFVEDAVQASSNPTGDRRCPVYGIDLRSWRELALGGYICNTMLYAYAYVGHKRLRNAAALPARQ